ncbi:MAG: single-stranded-DNA-specific exonuclease RecJ [Spirochaetaceae bacterium]|nr:single-stranded-DNA-specific exonuclease RecJ [Spirochaetaceae bacterium]
MVWEKKEIAREVVKELHDRFDCDPLTASILARRGITESSDILFYLEEDSRYLHSPFLFDQMEDAVDRIYSAVDEGEKVLIFGDRDADGITSTTILYQCLKDMGIDVSWRIPSGNDSYGLSMQAVEEFAQNYGSLIITVDCGITNNAEIERAKELGIDVIVVDHHNPQEQIPEQAIIINPKVENCGYPFKDLAGCGVTYKLISALQFAKSDLYKQQICLMNVRPANDSYIIECVKTVNCCETARISETLIPNLISINDTRLVDFLSGQQIFVWDAPLQLKMLTKIFGDGIDFNVADIRPEIASAFSGIENMSLMRLAPKSKLARYTDKESSELDTFFNLFVTFIQKRTNNLYTNNEKDLQLTAIATIADLMPLKNENRIIVKLGLKSMNTGKLREGLFELFSKQKLLGKRTASKELAFDIIPLLNSTGRLGQPEIAIKLFLEPDETERNKLADEILVLNKTRKQLGDDLWPLVDDAAHQSLSKYNNNLVIAADSQIHRGVTGILANKLAQCYNVPAIVIAEPEDNTLVGSIRSVRGYDVTELLEQCSDLFVAHGGHNFAAGFTLYKHNFAEFERRLVTAAQIMEFPQGEEKTLCIDAELPPNYITPDLLKLVDTFEPYGECNPQLVFLAKKLKIFTADLIGKDASHLKLTLSCGSTKWPALLWSGAERLKRDFDIGSYVDIVFNINRNTFNGVETPQMILLDIKQSQ